MIKKYKYFLFLFLMIFSIGLIGVYSYYNNSKIYFERKYVIIHKGASINKISEILYSEGLITEPRLFSFIVRLVNFGYPNFKAGEYYFPNQISPRNIAKILIKGEVLQRYITVPEGITSAEILNKINLAYGLFGDLPNTIEEASILPDTYSYTYGDKKIDILTKMQNDLTQLLEKEWDQRDGFLPFQNVKEALILASIVEKETSIEEERARIAAVFVNRLKKKMRLQADPTLIYGITKGQYKLNTITKDDLKNIENEYNTYIINGLPPTAIAHPGKASILAVLHPLDTDDLYFVANGNGGHNFANTLKLHNTNVKEYRTSNRK